MACEHDFRLDGIRQVYINGELRGSIDFYRCIKCGALELAARKLGEDTEQTYGFNNISDKWYIILYDDDWDVVRKSGEKAFDVEGKAVNLEGKKLMEITSSSGEIRIEV